MRVLTNAEMQKLIAAADKIVSVVGPLEARIAALEAAQGARSAGTLETRVARLEKIVEAARSIP